MKHRKFFVLSGEHPELAADEVVSISKSYDPLTSHESESRLLLIDSSAPLEKVARRATFVRFSGHVAGNFDSVRDADLQIPRPDTFACKVLNLSPDGIDTIELERAAGESFKKKWGSKVSLASPSLVLYIILTGTKKLLGYAYTLPEPKRPRKDHKFPHELEWKLARCMVNMSGAKEGQAICDPFCGTGSILLEAESMGIRTVGIDYDPRMCKISERNLSANGYESRIINSTYDYVRKVAGDVDAIVTDLPYGIASKSSADPKMIIRDFVSVIPDKTRLAIMYKKGFDLPELGDAKKYELFRHKSLTRVIVVI